MAVVEPKAQWANEPEFGSQADARSADAARVIVDFGLIENDVEHDGYVSQATPFTLRLSGSY